MARNASMIKMTTKAKMASTDRRARLAKKIKMARTAKKAKRRKWPELPIGPKLHEWPKCLKRARRPEKPN